MSPRSLVARQRFEVRLRLKDDSDDDDRKSPEREPTLLSCDLENDELRFLENEGLEFLAACRSVRSPTVRRSILALLRSLADDVDTDYEAP